MTVLDMLHKVGVEDNTSFYSGKGGRSDFVLNLIWHGAFDKSFQRHLSAVSDGKKLNAKEEEEDDPNNQKNVSIDQCFDEFKSPEILDEDNKWYCSKCKEHV